MADLYHACTSALPVLRQKNVMQKAMALAVIECHGRGSEPVPASIAGANQADPTN
jgi:hypothetical protein